MAESGSLIADLRQLETEALEAIRAADNLEAVEEVRITHLGRKEGRVSGILRRLGELPPEDRPEIGAAANRIKSRLQQALEVRQRELDAPDPGSDPGEDLTLPGRERWIGGRHPVTQVIDDLIAIFRDLGFTLARGPEAETEWYNFEALNTPLDHPAADEQDTLYLEGGHLLRSHTSPVQVRTLERYPPPVRILAPGMVYRRDSWDPTHTPAFLQLEGLAVDEGITFVDLKATLAEFARRFLGSDTRVRFRPSFFPFTEPSAEVDVKRVVRDGNGNETETDWIEIMGAGMVDPAVLEAAGVDPERYTGFAFGMGPGRIALNRYGIPDLRLFFENDVRFLRQFARP
ncbi:MAG: phenylalanine--tRNA ligase subunit alpha [Gemmatimonadota bacterium]